MSLSLVQKPALLFLSLFAGRDAREGCGSWGYKDGALGSNLSLTGCLLKVFAPGFV